VVDEASRMITRLDPVDAFRAARATGLIVDIRAQEARTACGVIPGSLHVPRTVLEWRAAPDSAWRSPYLEDLARQVIVICDHGYSSILAARHLVELGFRRASDVIGGFEGWQRAELPVVPCPRRSLSDELPGMGPPEPDDLAQSRPRPDTAPGI
jgi:rhodanese-related sulfurtransferase